MSDTGFTCGTHTASAFERGGTVEVGELTPLIQARWTRIRDDISHAEVVVPTSECCELLGDLRTILNELHIYRNGVPVWEGPITRIEYEWDVVRIFAEDMLWVPKRRVLQNGYNQSYPNMWRVLDRQHWLLWDQCFAVGADHWNMAYHLHPLHSTDEPQTTRVAEAFSMYVWEDFDKYSEDSGTDYTVVNRDIYYWDHHLAWKTIPPLDPDFIGQFPRIVEYGNELATRAFVTDGKGHAGYAVNHDWYTEDKYGWVDLLISNTDEGKDTDDPPTPEELAIWTWNAAGSLGGRAPSPVSIIVPANTTLLPGAPWDIDDLVPGARFSVTVDRFCRKFTDESMFHEIIVEESAPTGERISFSAIGAPNRVTP